MHPALATARGTPLPYTVSELQLGLGSSVLVDALVTAAAVVQIESMATPRVNSCLTGRAGDNSTVGDRPGHTDDGRAARWKCARHEMPQSWDPGRRSLMPVFRENGP